MSAGWFQDPLNGARERYWDGSAWSDAVRNPQPTGLPVVANPPPYEPSSQSPGGQTQRPEGQSSARAVATPGAETETEGSAHPRSARRLNQAQTFSLAIGGLVVVAGIFLALVPGASVSYEAVTDGSEYRKQLAEWAVQEGRASETYDATSEPIQTQTLSAMCGSAAQEFWSPDPARYEGYPPDPGLSLDAQMEKTRRGDEAAACAHAAPPRFVVPATLLLLGVGLLVAGLVIFSDKRRVAVS